MRHLRSGRRAGLSLAACSLLLSVPALADATSADTAAARALGVEGFKLVAAGKCGEAIDKLQRSESLHHALSVLEKLGECQVSTGKIVEGVESLRKVAREHLAADAPTPWVAAQEAGKQALEAAIRRMAHVNVTVVGPSPGAVSVTIDGAPLAAANLGVDRPLDPGDHVIAASADGFAATSTTLRSAEGAKDTIKLTLVELPHEVAVAPLPVPPPAPPAVEPRPPQPPPPRSHTAAYIVGGVGVAGIVVGAVSGFIALSDKSSLSSACHDDICPKSSASTLSGGQTAGNVSTVAFIVGGVGLGAGVALYFVHFGAKETAPGASAYVGPGSLGIRGSF